MLDASKVEEIAIDRIKAYRDLLNLQDWTTFFDMGDAGEGFAAENDIDAVYRTSNILVNPMAVSSPAKCCEIVLHECLHLWFGEFELLRHNMSDNAGNNIALGHVRNGVESAVSRMQRFMIDNMPEEVYGKWQEQKEGAE